MKKFLPFLLLAATASAAPVFTTEEKPNEIRVLEDGKLFCSYIFKDIAKPIVYPLNAPDGVRLNREFPMTTVEGESQDHPHHASLWFAHQDVNGQDTWNFKKGTITVEGKPEVKVAGNEVIVRAKATWRGSDGKALAHEESAYRFGGLAGGDRYIDVTSTLGGEGGPLKMGDAKDGAFAVRLRDEFNFKRDQTRALNSEGDDKKTIWSKRGRWVYYETEVAGKDYGVAMFDDAKNPLSPPRWHARDYGLLSVNPFGEKAFDPKSGKKGGLTIEDGKSATFHYRVVIYSGRKNAADVENLWKQFSATTGETK